jgi:hypothetical protein
MEKTALQMTGAQQHFHPTYEFHANGDSNPEHLPDTQKLFPKRKNLMQKYCPVFQFEEEKEE